MQRKSLGFMQLAIICGFALYYTWYLISFFGVFLEFPTNVDFTVRHIGQILFFAASVVVTEVILVAFRRANSVAIGHTRFLYIASLIPGSLVPACAIANAVGIAIPVAVLYIVCALSGASVAIGFMLWEDVTMHGYLNHGVRDHGVIFCAGGVIFLASTAFLEPLQLGVVAELALCAGTGLLAFITPRCDLLEDRPVEPVRKYMRDSWHVDIVSIVLNIAFGYAFIELYEMGSVMLLAVMAIAVCVDLGVSILLGHGKWIPFAGALRICVAAVACALLLYACPGDDAHRVALCVIVVFWFLFRTINGGSLTNLATRNGFSILYASTRGKIAANIGFTCGLALGLLVATFATTDTANLYVTLALVAAFILSALFLLPFENTPASAGYHTLALVDMHDPADSKPNNIDDLCARVSKDLKLSPRESEVLVFVMKGRNAKHVAEKLFISESTAKTHIANIYRKAGVHSQQELLDKFDM